jgi:4-hydroxybenzoate polyprenyltransferase
MKLFRQIFDFFLFSNIFISICASAMTVETFFLFHEKVNWFYVAFVFSSTLVLYNFPVFTETNFLPEFSPRHKWVSDNRKVILRISIVALMPSGVLIFFFPMKFILWLIPVSIIAFAYFIPQTHLRGITGMKTFIVAFVWTSITAIFPLFLISGFDLTRFSSYDNEWTIMLQNFFFIFPLCVIYNVRDIGADRKAGIKTFPVIYGVKVTILICMVSLALFSVLIVLSPLLPEERNALVVTSLTAAVLILFASEKRSDYYYTFWIDGMILLQVIFLALFSY